MKKILFLNCSKSSIEKRKKLKWQKSYYNYCLELLNGFSKAGTDFRIEKKLFTKSKHDEMELGPHSDYSDFVTQYDQRLSKH